MLAHSVTVNAGILLIAGSIHISVVAQTVYFGVKNGASGQEFVIALNDPQEIKTAGAILAGSERQKIHVMGKVIATSETYNKPSSSGIPWAFHLDPVTITFFHFGYRGCDGKTSTIDSYARAGQLNKYLVPPSTWCPWASLIVSELHEDGSPINNAHLKN